MSARSWLLEPRSAIVIRRVRARSALTLFRSHTHNLKPATPAAVMAKVISAGVESSTRCDMTMVIGLLS
jgi:hypothetical protein